MKDRVSARNQILEWAEQRALPQENVRAAFDLAGVTPTPQRWHSFLSALLLWVGALLLAAGVIFFFAYNWDAMGRFAKLGAIEAVLAAAIIAAVLIGPDKTAGKAALFLASALTGGLLALIGQTYQTGADPYELFMWWAILILPWTAISRMPALWLFWVVILNLAVGFYYQVFRGPFRFLNPGVATVWAVAVFNAVALIVWEFAYRLFPWMQERWAARILAAISGTAVTLLALWGIFESSEVGNLAIPVYLIWLAGAYFYYRHATRDVFVLAGGVLSAITFIASLMGKQMLRHADAGAFLFIGLVVIGLSALGAWWLKGVASEEAE